MATTTSNAGAAWAPDLHYYKASEVIGDSIALRTSTQAGVVEGDAPYVRVAWAGDGSASYVLEGAEIPQSEAPLNEVEFLTRKAAVLFNVSRELFDQPNAATSIANSASNGLIKDLDEAYLAGPAPTPPATAPVAGLLNQDGIVAGGEVSGSLDELVDLIAQLEVNGAKPSHVVVDPLGYAALLKLRKATGSNEGLLGAGVDTPELRILSLPVLKSTAITAYSGLVLSAADIVSAVGTVSVATSDQAFFTADSIAVRATVRFGWALPIPNRLGRFTIDDGTV
ncbi:phage major capsid protein [Nocardia cyriacigeorgica]|uniref:phage major capsid protein n=1 Tax=Nocardia cyriacigeorgica TaxID=135487 RepID=UPI002453C168|nr:phage major capsid protein [Nocardia cyriacigeorgica]